MDYGIAIVQYPHILISGSDLLFPSVVNLCHLVKDPDPTWCTITGSGSIWSTINGSGSIWCTITRSGSTTPEIKDNNTK